MVCSKFFGIVILGLSLAACSVENRRSKDYMPGRPAGSSTDQDFVPTSGQDFAASSGTNFRVDSVKVTNTKQVPRESGGYTANGVPKSKLFNFSACLKDSGGAALLPSMNFRILDGNGGTIGAATDVNGCLSWSEEHEYPHSTRESYFKLKRTIQATKPYRGAVYTVVGFDPWQKDGGSVTDVRTSGLPSGASLTDLGSLSLKDKGGLTAQSVNNQISANLDSIGFEFRGLDYDHYSIDPALNLTIAHKYQIRLKPTYLRRTFENIAVAEPFNGGCMKAYFAIFRERKAPADQYQLSDLISSSQFDVCDATEVGLYIADLSLKFPNVVDLTSRTLALVSLVPADEVPGLSEMSFYGVLKPGRLASLSLSPSKISARDLVVKAEARDTLRASQSTVNVFASQSGFRALDLSPLSVPGGFLRAERTIQPAELLRASLATTALSADQTRDLGLVLCDRLYSTVSASLVHSCQSRPQDFIAYGRRDFAEKILDRPIKQNREPMVDTLSMSIAYSSSKAETSSRGGKVESSFGANFGLGKDFLGGLLGIKMSAGASVFASRGLTESWGSTTSLSQKSEVSVKSEGHTFGFNAIVRPCIVATRVTPAWAASQVGELAKNDKGVFACASESRKEARAETFYLLSQNVGDSNSLFTDSDSSDEVSWRMFIRGTGTKTLLFNAVKASKSALVLEEIPAETLRAEVMGSLTTVQEFPGVLSAPTAP